MRRNSEIICVSYVDCEGKTQKESFGRGEEAKKKASAFVFSLMDQPEFKEEMLAEMRNKEVK